MRLIDADALKEQIENFNCKDCHHYNFVRCRACHIDDALSYIDNAPTVNGWISVKNSKPILSDAPYGVIICDANKNVHLTRGQIRIEIDGVILYFDDSHIDCYRGVSLLFWGGISVILGGVSLLLPFLEALQYKAFWTIVSGKRPKCNTLIKGNEITYWMPLPEPPKEEEK